MSSIGRLHGLCWENNDLRIIYLVGNTYMPNKQSNFSYARVTGEKKQKLKY